MIKRTRVNPTHAIPLRLNRCLRNMVLLISFLAWVCAAVNARALTLEDIAHEYEHKVEKVNAYQVRYHKDIVNTESGRVVLELHFMQQLLAGEGGYRLETSVLHAAGSEPVPSSFSTNDKEQSRSLSFTTSGKPAGGRIMPRKAPGEAYSTISFSPTGAAGLHDSSRCSGPADPNYFLTDIAAFARNTDSRLLEEPVMLGDEKAYLIEWPAASPRPLKRAWLSANKNLALLKYESYFLRSEFGEFEPGVQTTNTDFVEVTPGLFLPRKSEFFFPDNADNPAQVQAITVISYDMNVRIAPEDIRLQFPDGVRVDDQISGTKYIMGGRTNLKAILDNDTKQLARALDDAVAHDVVAAPSELVLARTEGRDQSTARQERPGAWVLVSGVLLLTVSAAVLFFWRRRKRLHA